MVVTPRATARRLAVAAAINRIGRGPGIERVMTVPLEVDPHRPCPTAVRQT
jgi:hypothetical protein